MEIIFIDAGNTTVDCRFYNLETKKIREGFRFLTTDFVKLPLEVFLAKMKFTLNLKIKVFYSSVVPAFNEWLEKLPNSFTCINIRKSKKIKDADFSFPWAHLGTDLIANFYAQSWDDAIIINCGTASTLSFIKNGIFQGTIIAPGVMISLDALISKAALLKPMAYHWETSKYGQDTKTAIGLGAINGHYEMLKALVNKRATPNTKIVFTGGNAKLFEHGIKNDNFEYNEALIFAGFINLLESI